MVESINSRWPFLPTCLNDILDQDTLAVIESGSCERLGRPLTILDFDPQTKSFVHRIESADEKQRYEEFCRYFREGNHIQGGDSRCKKWDMSQAIVSLQEFQKTGDPCRVFVDVQLADRLVKGVMMRGQEIHVTVDRDHFSSHGDLFVFGTVLDGLFASFSSINVYTVLIIKDANSREHYEWPARLGMKSLI